MNILAVSAVLIGTLTSSACTTLSSVVGRDSHVPIADIAAIVFIALAPALILGGA